MGFKHTAAHVFALPRDPDLDLTHDVHKIGFTISFQFI